MPRKLQEPTFRATVARNIHLYHDNGSTLGGIYQNGSLTHRHLYDMCQIFLEFNPQNASWGIFSLRDDGSTGQQLFYDATTAVPGSYVVLAQSGAPVDALLSEESVPRRILSRTGSNGLTPRRTYFRNAVRARDNHCMISGRQNPMAAVAHIFPHVREADWRAGNSQKYITDILSPSGSDTDKVHSPQNGILISAGHHAQFNSFELSINPDDDYRVVVFTPDGAGVDGRTLGFRCRDPDDPNRVSGQLLRWHFGMAVLANVRGVGEDLFWETDFPEGDMMGEVMESAHAAERMELELLERLGPGEGVS